MTGLEPSAFPSTTVALPLTLRHDAVRHAALLVRERVRWINKGGELLGRKLELVVEDNRSEPAASVAAPSKLLISTQADLIVAGTSSAGTRAMSAILVRRRIALFGRHVIPAGKA